MRTDDRKDSGVDWFGDIPAHWGVRRLGSLGALYKGRGGAKEDNVDEGVPVVRYGELYTKFDKTITRAHSFISEDVASNYTRLPTGSIVFAGSGEDFEDIGKSALSLLDEPAYVGGDTVIFVPKGSDADPLFLAYALESCPLKAMKALRSTGFTVVHISAGNLKTLPLALPPMVEQRRIADFLDTETAQIDTLIAEQERFIALLRERRRATRDELGTPVGVGDRMKWFIDEVDHRAGVAADSLPLMSVSIDWGVRRRDEITEDAARAEDLSNYKVCHTGEIVINRMRAFQGALGVAPEQGIVSPDYAVLRPRPGVDSRWLAEVMRSKAFVAEMVSRLRGIGGTDTGAVRTPRINVSDLREIRVTVPDEAEQQEQLARVTQAFERVDILVREAEHNIALSKERRSALITAAVTGQIDVGTGRAA